MKSSPVRTVCERECPARRSDARGSRGLTTVAVVVGQFNGLGDGPSGHFGFEGKCDCVFAEGSFYGKFQNMGAPSKFGIGACQKRNKHTRHSERLQHPVFRGLDLYIADSFRSGVPRGPCMSKGGTASNSPKRPPQQLALTDACPVAPCSRRQDDGFRRAAPREHLHHLRQRQGGPDPHEQQGDHIPGHPSV